MNVELKRALEEMDKQVISAPYDLANRIIFSIDEKAKQNAKYKALGLSFVSMISFFVSIPIIAQIITSFTQSGFYNYVSIIFSDSDVAMVYWKEIVMSLAESLPIIGIASLLAVAVIFTWSILKATSVVRNNLITA
ncbi:MAG: hypothetical protein WCQ00_02535 [bacterium]